MIKSWIRYHVFGLVSPSKDYVKSPEEHGVDRIKRNGIILSLIILLIWIWVLLFNAGTEINELKATITEQTRILAELQKVGG